MRTITVIAFICLLSSACSNEPTGSSNKEEKKDSTATAAPAAAASVTQTLYTCTMDTSVVSTTPGKCPKCGMELVLKK